jgi:hypothetical protein
LACSLHALLFKHYSLECVEVEFPEVRLQDLA